MTGRIHSFESFGTVDGPGIRFVVFLQGCPLTCAYCHNPDTQPLTGGKQMAAEQVIADAIRYRAFLRGGGITVTGGEPLCQPEFVAELFALAKQNGLHTCLDTSGICFAPGTVSKIDEVLRYTDLVMLDVKHTDEQAHKSLTGASNAPVLAFARYLAEKRVETWIRTVVVPGVTDQTEHAENLGKLIAELPNVTALDVLPYHTLGVEKYRTLGRTYALEGVPAATEDEARIFRDKVLAARKKVKRRL